MHSRTAGSAARGVIRNVAVFFALAATIAAVPAAAQVVWYTAGVAPPIMFNPSVNVISGGQSSWDWSITAPAGPLPPNPIPLGVSGNLVYQVDVFKNANGKVPQGTFSITTQVMLQAFGPPAAFSNIFVMLTGPGMNNRYNPVSCDPADRIGSVSRVITCNFKTPNLNLRGQSAGRTVSFPAYFLQAFATYTLRPKNVSQLGPDVLRSGQVAGMPMPVTIPSSNDDCATVSQIFDAAAVLPVAVNTISGPTLQAIIQQPVSYNPTPVCNSQRLSWTATFRFNRPDCQGSKDPAYPRQILSNFKLEPGPVMGTSRQEPLVFDVMTNVAYLACNIRPIDGGGFSSVPVQPAPKPSNPKPPAARLKPTTKTPNALQLTAAQQRLLFP